MTTYRMSDGTIVKTENAQKTWEEGTRWNGSNHISLATGTQFDHETLYRSRKGRYYYEHTSQWQGSTPHAEWVSNEEAARWLMCNEHEPDMPEELKKIAEEMTE